jgi:hypothetical protein
MVDPIVPLKLFAFKASHLRVGFRNRGVLRQIPIDDQFVAIG